MNRTCRRLAALAMVMVVPVACSGGGGTDSASPTTVVESTSTTSTTTTSTVPPTTAAPTTAPPTTAAPVTVPPTTAAPATTVRPAVTVAPTPVDPNAPQGTPAQRVSRGANGKPVVALSFDAGSDAGFTDEILDFLKAEGIKASFGMTGKWVEQNPDAFRRIVAAGHHIINHTYDHQSWTGFSTGKSALSRDARTAEITRAQDVFAATAGIAAPTWYRPPYGDIDKDSDALLGTLGYHYTAMWTIDSLGWQGLSAEAIAARCNKGLGAGVIILMHVGSQSQDAAALPAIVAAIRAAGLTPGSVPDVVL